MPSTDAILNAIRGGGVRGRGGAASRDIALSLLKPPDARGVADASRRLAAGRKGRLIQPFRDGKAAIEHAKNRSSPQKQRKKTPQKKPVPQQPTIEEYINQLPQLAAKPEGLVEGHIQML